MFANLNAVRKGFTSSEILITYTELLQFNLSSTYNYEKNKEAIKTKKTPFHFIAYLLAYFNWSSLQKFTA